MQQCQDHLEFQIETPDDQELARRFASRQHELSALGEDVKQYRTPKNHKPRNRKSKQQKRQERIARDANYRTKLEPEVIELECEGFEVSPGTGIMSGCNQSAGDCPTCGE